MANATFEPASAKKAQPKAAHDLLQLLYQSGEVSSTQLKMLRRYREKWETSGYCAVVDCHVVAEETLADILARSLGLSRLQRVREGVIPAAEDLNALGLENARKFTCAPVSKTSTSSTTIAVADPTDEAMIRCLEKAFPHGIVLAVGERRDILTAIDHWYASRAGL